MSVVNLFESIKITDKSTNFYQALSSKIFGSANKMLLVLNQI